MYLKSIEVHGFKSFANKIVFDFHNGITGIVGPNGSGKSNVADAVRWVLGEQKVKQLRSSSMQDVIFAGTENRKPISFAYVAITLDNSDHKLPLDFTEVTVARRVYRSGESEYLINGNICRLKDVNELFYDTGIGKEGYSIIGQGQIDKILSGKPEERRELFDEAAGIVKFKRRKATAQKKLEDEQQNLIRVNDILSELERQVGPLERQSEQAKIWLKKKEELKTYDVNLFLLEMSRIEQETKIVEEKQRIAKNQQDETNAEYEQIRQRYEELETAISENDILSGQLQQKISEAGMTKEKLEGQINVLREQIHAVQMNEEHLKSRMESLDAEISKCRENGEEYNRQRAELDGLTGQIEQEKQQIREKQEKVHQESLDCEQAMESGKAEVIRLLNERATMRAEQQRYDTMAEQANIRRSQLNQQLLTRKSTGSDVDTQLSEQEEKLQHIRGQIAKQEAERDNIEKKRRNWRTQFEELRGKLEEVKEQFHRESSRLESLKNIAERYDGYGNSIRRVMERRSDTPGICGVVADLIKVEKKYEVAIETALGGSIQNIVTEDENTAKKMIAYLKENRYGRATFLPLSAVSAPDKVPAAKALGETGVIGLADTLVQTEEKYRQVAGFLLGRVLVVDNIDHAVALEKKFHYSLRIVTLEGESLQPGGSMTGGAFKNNSNLLGRSREIESLEKSIRQRKEESARIRERIEDIRTASALLKDDLEELQVKLQESYLEQNTLEMGVSHMRAEKEQQEESYRGIQEEIRQIGVQEAEIETNKKQISARILESVKKEQEITEENQRLTQVLAKINARAEEISEQLSEISLREAQAQQKVSFIDENIRRVAEEMRRFEREKQELVINTACSGEEIQRKEQKIEQLTEVISAAGIKRTQLEEKIRNCAEKKEKMSAEHKGFFRKREELSEILSELDKETFRLNAQREKLESSEEEITNYMWQEYELTRHAAVPLKSEEYTDASDLKKRKAQVREEIRKLGNVNVNAIEEYKNVSERYTFLRTQHEDLLEAEKTLQDIIAELDEGMRKQFSEKFADIQREFDRAFKDLFGGGKGSLELTEEEDILECGVRIIAQPPGKKLQNMMQLSGGEKALTAIALLFAIQNLKPSPFCLLDEIEAALDDSNVDRFAKYLHKLTKNTQFIIITHRRGTMNAADRLYGITMQEKGVSTLVSVNLIENDLEE